MFEGIINRSVPRYGQHII